MKIKILARIFRDRKGLVIILLQTRKLIKLRNKRVLVGNFPDPVREKKHANPLIRILQNSKVKRNISLLQIMTC